MKEIGWGVIGCGGIADRRTIPEGIISAKDSRLVAVMSPHEEKVRRIARKYGVKRYYTKEEDLLRDPEVEVVYIATPNHLHHRQAIAAAEYGKHILCEKPLALTIKECEEIMSACRRNNVKLAVGFMMRFHACHVEALKLIKEGSLGKPVVGRAQLTAWYPDIPGAWRQDPALGGGGCLMDMGIHCIDLLRMFFGEVTEVSAFADTLVFSYPVEDSSLITLRFENGAYGVVDSFFNIPDAAAQNRLELYGTKGALLADGTIGQESRGKLKVYIQEEERGYDATQRREALGVQIRELAPIPINIYRAEVEDLIRCIREDSEPLNTGEEALKDQKIVLAAYESSKTGRKIKIRD
ncbi:MAG: Gfo/Idh/MocA family protein [Thermoproteota archaeon]